jgi:small-conductance mechanosensitive channel
VEFDLYVWIDDYMKKFSTESDLMSEKDRRFQENKIMLAFQGVKSNTNQKPPRKCRSKRPGRP